MTEQAADLRAAATLRSLSRIRSQLERIPETAASGNPSQLAIARRDGSDASVAVSVAVMAARKRRDHKRLGQI